MSRTALPFPEEYASGTKDYFLEPEFCLHINAPYERRRVDWALTLLERYAVVFPQPLPSPAILPAGQCFENATMVAGAKGVVYCEGMVRGHEINSGTPIVAMHAWCYHPTLGVMFDPTSGFVQTHPNVVYAGIPFNTVYVKNLCYRQKYFGVLDGHQIHGDDWGPYKDPEPVWLHSCWHTMERYHGPF